ARHPTVRHRLVRQLRRRRRGPRRRAGRAPVVERPRARL
ncbi:MAG: hypothetical protein AVDCRST_MAG79-835, partial [uncultured Thermoleophilia bacterium]